MMYTNLQTDVWASSNGGTAEFHWWYFRVPKVELKSSSGGTWWNIVSLMRHAGLFVCEHTAFLCFVGVMSFCICHFCDGCALFLLKF